MTVAAAGRLHRLAGRCLCGEVEYAVDDDFEYALNCHCTDCRRATGSAFKAFAGIPRDRLAIIREGRLLIHGTPDAGDTRCAACGSLLWSVVREGKWVHVTLGTLTEAPSIRPSAHIFTGSKAPWFEIADDLPRFEGHVVEGADTPTSAAGR